MRVTLAVLGVDADPEVRNGQSLLFAHFLLAPRFRGNPRLAKVNALHHLLVDTILELVHSPGVLEQVLSNGMLVLLHVDWQRKDSGLAQVLRLLEAEAGAIEGLVHEITLLELLVAPEREVHLLDFPRLDLLRVLLHGVPLGLTL